VAACKISSARWPSVELYRPWWALSCAGHLHRQLGSRMHSRNPERRDTVDMERLGVMLSQETADPVTWWPTLILLATVPSRHFPSLSQRRRSAVQFCLWNFVKVAPANLPLKAVRVGFSYF